MIHSEAMNPNGRRGLPGKHNKPLAARLMAKTIRLESGCLVWTGGKSPKGYGFIRDGRKMLSTHRAAFVLANGPIPDGLHVLHSCDRPSCVNPAHLRLGTNAENNADMMAKGRNRQPRGESNGVSRITGEIASAMRARYTLGESLVCLARAYGIDHTTVSRVVRRVTWRHVP